MYPNPDLLKRDVWLSPSKSKLICPYNDGYIRLKPTEIDIPSLEDVISEGWEDYIDVL